MKVKIIANCQFCNERVERTKQRVDFTCFDCKTNKKRERSKDQSYSSLTYIKRRNKLRKIRESFDLDNI